MPDGTLTISEHIRAVNYLLFTAIEPYLQTSGKNAVVKIKDVHLPAVLKKYDELQTKHDKILRTIAEKLKAEKENKENAQNRL